MIKPSSGGFNMDKFFDCDCPRCKPELYIINKDERIKELEQDIRDHEMWEKNYINKIKELEDELERYKEFVKTLINEYVTEDMIKEFEETKE